MKFVFDEVFYESDNDDISLNQKLVGKITTDVVDESSLSSPNVDYTYINESEEDENIPLLRLPKKKVDEQYILIKSGNNEAMNLEPGLVDYMDKLQLDSRLPKVDYTMPILISTKIIDNKLNTNQLIRENDDQNKLKHDDTSDLMENLQNSFTSKLNSLVNQNLKQVEDIKTRKQKEEDERRRKIEEKRKRQEDEIRRAKEEEEIKRKEEEDRKKHELEVLVKQKKETELKEKVLKEQEELKRKNEKEAQLKYSQNVDKEITNFKEIDKTFLHYKEKIKEIKRDIIEPVKSGDKNLKNLLSKHKRRINPKFGQLTNSTQQLKNVFTELVKLIDETRTDQLSYNWILNFITKAIVSQAETEVRVKPESSLALGQLTVLLMCRYEELVELLKARFVKKCPFVIGFSCKIDTEEGRLRMGWKRNEDNKWEEDTTYDERMGGMMTLYAVITRLPAPLGFDGITPDTKNPIPISESWKFLARICNMDKEILTNTHFIIICSWWEAAGNQFIINYGKQGEKLLKLVGSSLINSVSNSKFIGAARLSILIEEWITTGIIKSFPEMVA